MPRIASIREPPLSLSGKSEIGQHIRRRRRAKRMNLQQMSDLTGLSISTLSKIENSVIELSYTRMIVLSEALGINLTELVTEGEVGNTPSVITARRSITRTGDGSLTVDDNYESNYLNTDISKKQMIPAVVTVKHRTLEEFGPMSKHKGEEFILVISGEIEFHSEHYNPVRLKEGDSIYIDSTMSHAMISVSRDLANVLSVCTHEIPEGAESRAAMPAVTVRATPAQSKPRRKRTVTNR
jgi:transcriptional regulator with XRE-family HTH domain